MARLTSTLSLRDPVDAGGETIAALSVVEPTVRDFLDLGPLTIGPTGKLVTLRIDIPGRCIAYLRRCLGMDSTAVDALLAGMSLADGMALKAVLTGHVFTSSRDDVMASANAIVFDWRLLSLDAVDALGLSDLATYCQRLTHHAERLRRLAKK